LDTSVFGGVFDTEFTRPTKRLFAKVNAGVFLPVVSAIVADEITEAPQRVRLAYERCLLAAEVVAIDEPALALRDAGGHRG
jgi:hypothetical protein